AEHEPRSKAFTVKREHQPPCLGATISTSSAGANWVAERATAATTLPFTAVAIFASAKPSRAQSSSSVFASVAKASPLSRIFKKTPPGSSRRSRDRRRPAQPERAREESPA